MKELPISSLWVGEFIHDLSACNTSFSLVFCLAFMYCEPMHNCAYSNLVYFCLYSIWDKVIAGSCMILVYVAVAVLLSVRRKILGLQIREDISHLLSKVCCVRRNELTKCI